MRGDCALSLRGMWHTFNREGLAMIPRPSEGRVAQEAALHLWRWQREDVSSGGAVRSLAASSVTQTSRRYQAGDQEIHRGQRRHLCWRYLRRTRWAVSIHHRRLLPLIAFSETLSRRLKSDCQRGVSTRSDFSFTALPKNSSGKADSRCLDVRRNKKALRLCGTTRRLCGFRSGSALVAVHSPGELLHRLEAKLPPESILVSGRSKWQIPQGIDEQEQARASLRDSRRSGCYSSANQSSAPRKNLGTPLQPEVAVSGVAPNCGSGGNSGPAVDAWPAFSEDAADLYHLDGSERSQHGHQGGRSRVARDNHQALRGPTHAGRDQAGRAEDRPESLLVNHGPFSRGKIGGPSLVGVSEAGSCYLGSRNLGCLEVGRLARSPSHFQAWECAS